ncbi:MAG: saccharopine dehydrogenase NADP-binding domain-containing protein [Phycisphaerales bacterium]|nr:saccharopine dehydrogenase NADP-binding domain-containing protein [Phycisphaerales bacterium]MCI0630533.1 saccharopine dehydrogenase NADP-binding domain-containing protein [Phycisphaerales bacterium]MCI0676464.1 saccharopine dehydrogenase NADP-binding domain-containing protein [Phycisphaerales bacterium]
MPTAIVLGAGMVGSVMAADLAEDHEYQVTAVDMRPEALRAVSARSSRRVKTVQADLGDPSIVRRMVGPFDIVLGSLASAIGFQTLQAVIEAGRNYCDISFMPQDAWELDRAAKSRGVTAVVDCGVAPGMSNMMAGYAAAYLDECQRIEIYVGGLPREPKWPYQYKAGFSPHDVVEEYVRPSRVVEHGRMVVKEALSEPELMEFPGVGTLEAFNTDGLRSIAHFIKAPFMKEKTLRYPGHIELMRVFRETGLFSHEPIDVRGVKVRPIDVTSALMFPKWTYEPGEEDLTVMRVIVEGLKRGKRERMTWDLLDFYHQPSRATSMSRTTAFPCTIVARLIAAGKLKQPGVLPPEVVGREPGMLEHVVGQLAQRGVHFRHTKTNLDG